VKYVYREHLDTSVRMGVDILKMLNYRSYTLHRSAQNFIAYDEAAMRQLYKLRHDQSQYVSEARKQIEMQEELLNNDFVKSPSMNDHAWDSDEMKQVLRK
jgi:CPA2 family monovalent cation:H+ antiporter-2